MYGLAYVSQASEPFSDRDLRQLADHAAEKNARLDVTGYLVFSQGTFLQYLEGEKRVVGDLMEVIRGDERHQILNVVPLGDVGDRRFAGWSMRYISAGDLRTVQLEDILENILKTMRSPAFKVENIRNTVMRLVNRLAEVRNRRILEMPSSQG